jgi:hypothetical protein
LPTDIDSGKELTDIGTSTFTVLYSFPTTRARSGEMQPDKPWPGVCTPESVSCVVRGPNLNLAIAQTDLGHGLRCEIEAIEVAQADPPTHVYQVVIIAGNNGWNEVLPTREHLESFWRGFTAAVALVGNRHIPQPEFPRVP